MDCPEESRAADFDGQLETAKNAIKAAQSDFENMALAEPDIPEHRTTTREGAELRAMLDVANVGEAFDRIIAHGQPTGAMAELQQHLGMEGNMIPLALLETRAVTPAPGNVGQNQAAILPYVFPQSAAAFLGVDMPTVGVGEAVFPVLTSTLAVGTPAENAGPSGNHRRIFGGSPEPRRRIQAAFFYSREDRARFAGMDSALRENLSEGLADGLDKAILAGTNGLFAGTNLPNNAQTTDDTFDSYLSNLVWNQIDGRYAAMASDLAMVVGAATYKDLGATYRNTSVDRSSALDRIMELVSGVRVSAHVPAPSSNRQDVVIRRGSKQNRSGAYLGRNRDCSR